MADCSARVERATAKLNGYLEDYAFLADALVTLYEATFETRYLAPRANSRTSC